MMDWLQRIYNVFVPHGGIDRDLEEALIATKKLRQTVEESTGKPVEELARELRNGYHSDRS